MSTSVPPNTLPPSVPRSRLQPYTSASPTAANPVQLKRCPSNTVASCNACTNSAGALLIASSTLAETALPLSLVNSTSYVPVCSLVFTVTR